MGSEWRRTKIGSLLSFSNGRTSPERADCLPYPVYGANGIIGYANESNANDASIVIGRVGTYCGSLYLCKQPCWVTDNAIRATARDDNDLQFLFYLLGTLSLNNWRAGSGQPLLNQNILSCIPAVIPSLPEQRAIAHILGTLDDKIELNRRMNETLEAMARALFRSWFVDFEPVRIKQSVGRVRRGLCRNPTGSPCPTDDVGLRDEAANPTYDNYLTPEILDLFPDSFEDSEMGEVPKGWRVQCIKDIGEVICGKTPSTQIAEYSGNDVPFITIPEMHGKVFASTIQRKLSYTGAYSQKNKMLPLGSICVSCIATPGLVVITTENSQTNQQINSVIPSVPNEYFFWYWCLRDLGENIRAAGSGGSVLANLSTGRFSDLQILVTPYNLRKTYHRLVNPIFNRLLANDKENTTLATLRDTLLPKLLSGEIRVKDAEKMV